MQRSSPCIMTRCVSPDTAKRKKELAQNIAASPIQRVPTDIMCKDDVNLPKEANRAKCFVIACLVSCAGHRHALSWSLPSYAWGTATHSHAAAVHLIA